MSSSKINFNEPPQFLSILVAGRKTIQKRKNVHEMGRRGSKITFNRSVLRNFSRYG